MRTPRIPAAELCRLGRLALPLMTPEARAEAETLIGWITENESGQFSVFSRQRDRNVTEAAAAAFEADMRPVREAIIAALDDGDMESLRGLRALLPHLLSEVNEQPGLADVLAHQLGAEFLAGFSGGAESGELRAATGNGRPWDPELHPRGGRGRFAEADKGGAFGGGEATRDDLAEMEREGLAAVEKSLSTREDVMNAMHLPEGTVDFRWGNDGEGVRHVLKRAEDRLRKFGAGPTGEEVMRMMPTVLARGKSRHLGERVLVKEWTDANGQEWRAALARDFHGVLSNKWLLSGYDVDEQKRGNRG